MSLSLYSQQLVAVSVTLRSDSFQIDKKYRIKAFEIRAVKLSVTAVKSKRQSKLL